LTICRTVSWLFHHSRTMSLDESVARMVGLLARKRNSSVLTESSM